MLKCISEHGTEDPEQGKQLAALALGVVKHLGAGRRGRPHGVAVGARRRFRAAGEAFRSAVAQAYRLLPG